MSPAVPVRTSAGSAADVAPVDPTNAPRAGVPSARPNATGGSNATALPVTVVGVSKVFGATSVLTSVDLHVDPGQTVAVLGPSGCGKSTLLRLIAGLDTATAGRVLVGDTAVVDVDPRVAVVFQQPRLLPWLDLAGNVALGATRRRRDDRSAGDSAEVAEALDRVGLTGHGHQRPAQVSGGMAQRAALARALVATPSVLLLDEPFAALDAITRLQVQDHVDALTRELGTTVLLVTHDVDEALRLADRVVVMGRAGSGSLTEVDLPHRRPRDVTDPDLAAALAPVRDRVLHLVGAR